MAAVGLVAAAVGVRPLKRVVSGKADLWFANCKDGVRGSKPKRRGCRSNNLTGYEYMPHAGERDLVKEQHWRQVFSDWGSSGLSVAQYCNEYKISRPSFYEWKRTIAKRDAEATRVARDKRPKVTRAPHSQDKVGSFAEVRVADAYVRTEQGESTKIEVELRNGIKVRLEEHCSMPFLVSLFEFLEER